MKYKVFQDQSIAVETADYLIRQANNGHIHVLDKSHGRLILHVNRPGKYTPKELQAFAERFQAINGSTNEVVHLLC